MEFQYTLVIATIGFIASFVTSVSGGGGLIAVPAFLALGIPPVNALALNRLSYVGIVCGAGHNYFKAKAIDWRLVIMAAPLVALGNFIGAKVVIQAPPSVLSWAVLCAALLALVIIVYPFNKVGKEQSAPAKFMVVLGLATLFLQGMWDGAFAMAGATLGTLVYIYFFKKDFLQARAIELFSALPGAFVSAFVLTVASNLSLLQISTVFIASMIGSYAGSHLAIKTNGKIIRYFMILIAILMLTKVAFDLLSGASQFN